MARHETVYTVWNHVYEVQEQAWLFYRERTQNNGYFGGEWWFIDWEWGGRETSGMLKLLFGKEKNIKMWSNLWQVLARNTSEKAMAPYSSTLAWKIPWAEEPGGLQSMGSLRVGLDWATSLSLFTFMHWRRKWQPTPVFLPGESQGQESLVGCRLWGRTESDTTEAT